MGVVADFWRIHDLFVLIVFGCIQSSDDIRGQSPGLLLWFPYRISHYDTQLIPPHPTTRPSAVIFNFFVFFLFNKNLLVLKV